MWESLVKSVKTALKVIIKDRIFTEETLQTFLCEVESILRGQLITSVRDDTSDFEPLTQNHLLIGEVINLRRKWHSVQAATKFF